MVTMNDIAKAMGVSRTTVSFVLNDRYKDVQVSESLACRVRETAERMGYVRNKLMDSVVTGKSNVIAIISAFHDFIMPMIAGCIEEAAKHGYVIKLIPLDADVNKAIRQAVEFRVAGVFVNSLSHDLLQKVDPKFFSYGIPSLGLTPYSGRMAFDQKRSAGRGTEYLIRSGHRRIIFYSSTSEISHERENGYREVMERYGLESVILRDLDFLKPEDLFEEILAFRPDAVQCYSDYYALDLMHYCYRKRLFIPETFSLLGFGNITGGRHASPHLTTIDEPYYEEGQLIFSRIRSMIETGKDLECELKIGEVIERESVQIKNN